jgi:hypothetical protein
LQRNAEREKRSRHGGGDLKEADEFRVMEEFIELIEGDMYWYEPKVMSEERKENLTASWAHPDLAIPILHQLQDRISRPWSF